VLLDTVDPPMADELMAQLAGVSKIDFIISHHAEQDHSGVIPRVLDAGQCNESCSLAVIAMKLKEVFGLDDINELPVPYDIAWYEQKAVAVLLALLYLGVKGIRLGPILPAFLSPNVAKVLVEKFDIKPIGTVEEDIAAMMAGN
jgi:hydroxylamine reductase